MKNLYKKHVFVCVNNRDSSNKKSCGVIGAEIRIKLKEEIIKRNLNSQIRINKSGCLGKCGRGPCLVVYPEGEWYFNSSMKETDQIINKLISED